MDVFEKVQYHQALHGDVLVLNIVVFVDGTYEGALMAAAGVFWTIGHEGREELHSGELSRGRAGIVQEATGKIARA